MDLKSIPCPCRNKYSQLFCKQQKTMKNYGGFFDSTSTMNRTATLHLRSTVVCEMVV
jgi:hypothetical protein